MSCKRAQVSVSKEDLAIIKKGRRVGKYEEVANPPPLGHLFDSTLRLCSLRFTSSFTSHLLYLRILNYHLSRKA